MKGQDQYLIEAICSADYNFIKCGDFVRNRSRVTSMIMVKTRGMSVNLNHVYFPWIIFNVLVGGMSVKPLHVSAASRARAFVACGSKCSISQAIDRKREKLFTWSNLTI